MANRDRLMEAVREILLREWDPIGVAQNPDCSNEYDRYVRTVCRYLDEGIDEFKLTAYLSQVQTVEMGLSSIDEVRNKAIARLLLSLLE